jgi:hypothetical protein
MGGRECAAQTQNHYHHYKQLDATHRAPVRDALESLAGVPLVIIIRPLPYLRALQSIGLIGMDPDMKVASGIRNA